MSTSTPYGWESLKALYECTFCLIILRRKLFDENTVWELVYLLFSQQLKHENNVLKWFQSFSFGYVFFSSATVKARSVPQIEGNGVTDNGVQIPEGELLLQVSYLSSSACYITRLLDVPKTKLKTKGDRAFEKIAPTLWNDLPVSLRTVESVVVFKGLLKTHLFRKHFG